MTEQAKETAIIQATPAELQLSEQSIEVVKRNIDLCQQLVRDVLEQNVDWGTIPGVPQPFLWDSGAAKVTAAFNCYADYKVIESVTAMVHIRYTIVSHLINRQTQQIVATGIGAASTKEIKHRYRWVDDPEKQGISRKGLKQNKDGKYRIPNPDTEDLLNTIAKMAAKRADVDAAQSLPGVAATLHKLFHPTTQQRDRPGTSPPVSHPPPNGQPTTAQAKQAWSHFWAQLRTLNISHKQAHDILAVNSITEDWLGVQGRTLDAAYQLIKNTVHLTKAGEQVDQEFERHHPSQQPLTPNPQQNTEKEDLWPTSI